MDMEKWIKENSGWCEEGDFGHLDVIAVDDLRELLKTHTIVPNEPTEAMLDQLLESRAPWDSYAGLLKAAQENS